MVLWKAGIPDLDTLRTYEIRSLIWLWKAGIPDLDTLGAARGL